MLLISGFGGGFITLMMAVGNMVFVFGYPRFCFWGIALLLFSAFFGGVLGFITLMMFMGKRVCVFSYLCIQVCVFWGILGELST